MMTISKWIKIIHALSVEKGWHDEFVPVEADLDRPCDCVPNGESCDFHKEHGDKIPHWRKRSDLESLALMHSEISEATEEFRKDEEWDKDGITKKSLECDLDCQLYVHEKGEHEDEVKPEGPSTELVDTVIRIFDYFGEKGWDFERVLQIKHQYNKGRPHRHGNKKY